MIEHDGDTCKIVSCSRCDDYRLGWRDGWLDATDHIANIVINHADGCDCDQCLGWRTVVGKVWLEAAHEGKAESG